jgi:hypothetical protein
MKEFLENEQTAVRYLFGELSNVERDEFEERLFLDQDLSLSVDNVENDLIDDYARGELESDVKRKFEEKFLTSESRRERVRLAKVLQTKVFNERPLVTVVPETTFWQSWTDFFRVPSLVWAGSLAIALLMLLLGGFWLLRPTENNPIVKIDDNQNVSNEPIKQISPQVSPSVIETPSNSNAAPEKPKPAPLKKQTEKEPKPEPVPQKTANEPPPMPKPRHVFAFSLLPTLRNGENPVLNVPPNVSLVRLRVVHRNQEEFIKYRAEIRNSDGETVWSQEIPVNRKTRSQPLVLNVESDTLKPDTYELALLGVTREGQFEETNFYNFVVRKK